MHPSKVTRVLLVITMCLFVAIKPLMIYVILNYCWNINWSSDCESKRYSTVFGSAYNDTSFKHFLFWANDF